MKFIKSITLVLALGASFSANAQSFDWSSLLGSSPGNSGASGIGGLGGIGGIFGGGGGFESIIFNAAYMYASKDPKYAAILRALGINSGADLQAFLMGEQNGSNAEDIVNQLSFEYAKDNPAFASWLTKSGVKDVPSLRAFRKTRGSKYKKTLNQMALAQARDDADYQEWLNEFGIEDLNDLQGILSGDGGNILQKLWPLAKNYLMTNNPEYAQYIPLIESLLGLSGGEVVIDDPVLEDDFNEIDPPEVVEGSYRGISVREIKVIQKAKLRRAPVGGNLLNN